LRLANVKLAYKKILKPNALAYFSVRSVRVKKRVLCSHNFSMGSMIHKHNARWLHISRLKAGAVYSSFQKTFNLNKTCQLKPGKGTGMR
jgi:hypothetical protein